MNLESDIRIIISYRITLKFSDKMKYIQLEWFWHYKMKWNSLKITIYFMYIFQLNYIFVLQYSDSSIVVHE